MIFSKIANVARKKLIEPYFTGTGVKQPSEAVSEGLRYVEDQGVLGNMLNRYYSNLNRGSKLTRRGQVQDTDLGRLKVNVGRVPLQETSKT